METIASVHRRTLAAAADEVGALLDTIASDQDRLWPTDKWPATPIRFDRPLAVGADGGHGMIRYSVSAYEPGRRIAFTFTPGGGLEGTHELRVEPCGASRTTSRHDAGVASSGASRTTLTHELVVTPAWWMRPVAPLLLRAHDALIEDLLDRAQLATDGHVEQPARWPRWLKLANAAEALLLRRGAPDRAARTAGVGVPAILAALAALHAAWALGSSWPAGSHAELADAVLSSSEGMPPDWATWAVAGLLALAAVVVRRAAAGEQRSRVLTIAIAGAFGARAVAYLPSDLAGGLATTYQRFDLALYAPLCLLIAVGAAVIVRRHGAAGTPLPA